MVHRFRSHQDDIMADLPLEAELGLFHVDCRVLRHRLQVWKEGGRRGGEGLQGGCYLIGLGLHRCVGGGYLVPPQA